MKNRYVQYILLLALFVVGVTYQTRYTIDAVRDDFYPNEQVREPFVMEGVDPVITRLRPEAEEAGLRKGDLVLAVGGRPLKGSAVFDQLAAEASPGDSLSVDIRRASDTGGQAEEKSFTVR